MDNTSKTDSEKSESTKPSQEDQALIYSNQKTDPIAQLNSLIDKYRDTFKNTAQIVVVGLLVLAVGVTYYQIGQQQNLKGKAETTLLPTPTSSKVRIPCSKPTSTPAVPPTTRPTSTPALPPGFGDKPTATPNLPPGNPPTKPPEGPPGRNPTNKPILPCTPSSITITSVQVVKTVPTWTIRVFGTYVDNASFNGYTAALYYQGFWKKQIPVRTYNDYVEFTFPTVNNLGPNSCNATASCILGVSLTSTNEVPVTSQLFKFTLPSVK